jgi:lipopolysaccharide transport system permease protein
LRVAPVRDGAEAAPLPRRRAPGFGTAAIDRGIAELVYAGRSKMLRERMSGPLIASVSPSTLFMPFERAWRHRELIRAVARREFISRFRGSILGPLWAVISPILVLATYTTLWSVTVPQLVGDKTIADYSAEVFIGLITFNFFSELAYRAPMLLHEHVNFVKKSIFPSETLAWTAVLRSLTYTGIGLAVMLVFALAINRTLPATVLLLPFLVAPLILGLLGFVWCLSALGAFTRDIAYLMITIVPLLMFATPVFYRMSDLPPTFRVFEYFNPIAVTIDISRNILIDGILPPLWLYAVFVITSLVICRGGYAVFERYKGILVDVI